jgi:hypothetical protein
MPGVNLREFFFLFCDIIDTFTFKVFRPKFFKIENSMGHDKFYTDFKTDGKFPKKFPQKRCQSKTSINIYKKNSIFPSPFYS